ncbi:unnamed protein product [Ectocarpus sp. 13 AM-2016]
MATGTQLRLGGVQVFAGCCGLPRTTAIGCVQAFPSARLAGATRAQGNGSYAIFQDGPEVDPKAPNMRNYFDEGS